MALPPGCGNSAEALAALIPLFTAPPPSFHLRSGNGGSRGHQNGDGSDEALVWEVRHAALLGVKYLGAAAATAATVDRAQNNEAGVIDEAARKALEILQTNGIEDEV